MTPQAMCADVALKAWYHANWNLKVKTKVVLSHSSKTSRYLMVNYDEFIVRISDHQNRNEDRFKHDAEVLICENDNVDAKVKELIGHLEGVYGSARLQ